MAAIQFYGREIKKPRLQPGFSAAPHSSAALTIVTAHYKKRSAVYMGRKKKLINKTNVPQYAVERFARCVFDDIRADFARPEVQAEFALWLAEREQNKKTRAAKKTAALVSVMGNKQIIRTRFRFGRYGSDYFALVHQSKLNSNHFRPLCFRYLPG